MDKIDDIIAAMAILVRNGYTVTYDSPPLQSSTGIHLHVFDEIATKKPEPFKLTKEQWEQLDEAFGE